MELGKKWRADVVDVCDGKNVTNEAEDWEFRQYVAVRLQRALQGEEFKRGIDAVIISY